LTKIPLGFNKREQHTQKYIMGVEACRLGSFIKLLGATVKTKHSGMREPVGAGFWLILGGMLVVAIVCYLYLSSQF
jgi:hypothetical protein